MKLSVTITSLIVLLLGAFLKQAGINVGEGEIQQFVAMVLQIAGAVGVYWGRYRQGDISAFGVKQ